MGKKKSLQLLHRVHRVVLVADWRVPQVQSSSPQTHLHVPGAPAVLPVFVGGGRVELRIPQVSEDEIRVTGGLDFSIKLTQKLLQQSICRPCTNPSSVTDVHLPGKVTMCWAGMHRPLKL